MNNPNFKLAADGVTWIDKRAESRAPRTPVPLTAARSAPTPFPVAALGPVLAPFVEAVVEGARCADTTAAQSALGVAALATQGLADVTTPAIKTRPASLFLLTVALSGERKSAADEYAMTPLRNAEAHGREGYRRAWADWRNRFDGWEGERAKIKRSNRLDADGRRLALGALGPEPCKPLRIERTTSDATAEGLVKNWPEALGSLGIFADEGAKVIGGHGMSDDARLRTVATWANLWDRGAADRTRGGDGVLTLRGRRLSMHLMAQPGVAASFLGAADLIDQGITAQFLVAEAVEKAGTRLFREPPPATDSRFVAFNEAVANLLAHPFQTLDGRNELAPRAVVFSPAARNLWIDLHDQVETKLGSGGELHGVKAFGSKLAEHAARLAAVLTIFGDPDAGEIDTDTMARVVELASFYASEAERLATLAATDRAILLAERLRMWLLDTWDEDQISIRAVQQYGPNAIRDGETAARCVEALQLHGWLVASGAGKVRGERARETFAVVRIGGAP